jgi:hypothetical protein
MMVLWLLVGRALGIEFRHQIENPMWTSVWDVIFSLVSGALALFFGVALGTSRAACRSAPTAPSSSRSGPTSPLARDGHPGPLHRCWLD